MARGKKDKANVFLTWLKKILIIAGAVFVYILSPLDILPTKPYDDLIVGIIGVVVIIIMSISDLINGTDSTYEMVDQVRRSGKHYEHKYVEKKREERYAQNLAYQSEKRKQFEDMKKMDANKQQRFEHYKAKEERKQAEQVERDKASSFDTDEFFNASVKRSSEHIAKRAREHNTNYK